MADLSHETYKCFYMKLLYGWIFPCRCGLNQVKEHAAKVVERYELNQVKFTFGYLFYFRVTKLYIFKHITKFQC